MTRTYRKRKRAELEAETRLRIIEAAVELHTTVGPARTSIAAIAKRAGVQRHTVYAHFADERSLFRACSAHWESLHPLPDPAAWLKLEDPLLRLRGALEALYGWYEEVADAVAVLSRDASVVPAVAAQWEAWAVQLARLADTLAAPLGRSRPVRAAVGHAIAFETWRSLVQQQGLTNKQAVRAMVGFVENV
jgi:AcrR family transcriptional regulator